MAIVPVEGRKRSVWTRLIGAAMLASVLPCCRPNGAAGAGSQRSPRRQVPSDSQMLLEADTLIYDNDNDTVTAVGGVQIEYAGNRLVAQRVVYNRKTGRVVASGNVEIIDSDGTKIYSDEIDITDDFANGFVNALRVETIDKTYFAAESAERKGGRVTTFNNGVYTACEPCEEKPDRAPIWRVKAQKIIWDGKAKTVRFQQSRFEFFGLPIAYMPVFEMADPTVKRKTGFLLPGINYKSELGFGVSVPFYIALVADLRPDANRPLLFQAGFPWPGGMAPALQQRLLQPQGGRHPASRIRARSITRLPSNCRSARRPEQTPLAWSAPRACSTSTRAGRSAGTSWRSPTRTSPTPTASAASATLVHRSEVFLTGLHDRNYFDLRAMHFDVQEESRAIPAAAGARRQAALGPADVRLCLHGGRAGCGWRAQHRRQRARAQARRSSTVRCRAMRPRSRAASRATTAA